MPASQQTFQDVEDGEGAADYLLALTASITL